MDGYNVAVVGATGMDQIDRGAVGRIPGRGKMYETTGIGTARDIPKIWVWNLVLSP